ncbi:hypothetical protein PMAYCL1PPCAC_31411, partial [Pristionchus mayeri]
MLPTSALGWFTFIVKHIGPLMVLVVICLCVYSLHRVPDLRSTPLFSIVRVLMLLDISYIIIGKAHNIPCEIAGQALYG